MASTLEFYFEDKLIESVGSSIVPPVDSLINIRGITYSVYSVTYAVDRPEEAYRNRIMRANIDLTIA